MISVLIPFRGYGAWRDRVWAHCRKLWAVLDVELVVGTDDGVGPFKIAQAFNDAASRATGDVFILYGADHIPDWERITWAAKQLETHEWCALYANTSGYGEASTNAIFAGAMPSAVPQGATAPFCTAIIGIRREAWIPYDERFTGWGCEDSAWRLMLETIYGLSPDPTGTLMCLYHEGASRDHFTANAALMGEYMAAADEGRMVEYIHNIGLT